MWNDLEKLISRRGCRSVLVLSVLPIAVEDLQEILNVVLNVPYKGTYSIIYRLSEIGALRVVGHVSNRVYVMDDLPRLCEEYAIRFNKDMQVTQFLIKLLELHRKHAVRLNVGRKREVIDYIKLSLALEKAEKQPLPILVTFNSF